MKQNSNLTTLGQIQRDTQDAYLSAPLLTSGTAYSAITVTDLSGNKRSMRDPSQTLRPAMGIERVHAKALRLAVDEKGPAGEQVWKLDNGDDRIRFIGTGWVQNSTQGSMVYTGTANDYLEVTFYGTGLNLLTNDAASRQAYASIDGAAESVTNIFTTGASVSVLQNRNTSVNNVKSVASNLTLGNHTVKIRFAAIDFYCYGFEILNESASINLPKGEILSAGRKEVIGTATTTAYNSGFDGSPTLNGRGGRVIVYSKDGRIGKVIQQTDASQANLTSADHSNEEIIRSIHWREFSANRADDFTGSIPASSNKAFTLDDGTTTLLGSLIESQTSTDTLRPSTTNSTVTFTFIGTGLDVIADQDAATAFSSSPILIDGISIGDHNLFSADSATNILKVRKIVSGLPYGTHTFKYTRPATGNFFRFKDFIVYGPKKRSIPSGAIEIGEYYLMANYVANATAGGEYVGQGTMRKVAIREMTYKSTTAAATLDVTGAGVLSPVAGWYLNIGAVASNYWEYTFFGTGFDMRVAKPAGTATTATITVDGASNLSGFTTSSYGVTSFTPATGVYVTGIAAEGYGNGISVSGLALGLHTVRATYTSGSGMFLEAIDIITPIHFPNTKRGSLSLAPSASFAKQTDVGSVDMSKAKAWVNFDAVNSTILSSYNVSAVLTVSAGVQIIYFEKTFKDSKYAVTSALSSQGTATSATRWVTGSKRSDSIQITTTNTSGTPTNGEFTYAFFGELADEEND